MYLSEIFFLSWQRKGMLGLYKIYILFIYNYNFSLFLHYSI